MKKFELWYGGRIFVADFYSSGTPRWSRTDYGEEPLKMSKSFADRVFMMCSGEPDLGEFELREVTNESGT